jgi:O-antigen biosynthesis protein
MRHRLFFRFKRAHNLIQRGLRSLQVRGLRASLAMISPGLKQQTRNSGIAQLSAADVAALLQQNFYCASPHISIIIPVHNQLALTQYCLAALVKHPCKFSFEVIVVNDASQDETEGYLSTLNGLKVISHTRQMGFVDSCNDGAKAAQGTFLVFLNNDTQLQANALTHLIETFNTFPDTGVAGGKLLYPNGRLQEAGAAIFSDASAWNIGRFENANDSCYQFVRECDYVSGATLAIRRDVFERLNGFDALFSPGYYEDADLCFRVSEAGLKVRYQSHAVVLHVEGASSETSAEPGMKAYQTINQQKFSQRWQHRLQQQPKRPSVEADSKALLFHHHASKFLFIDEKMPTPQHDSGSLRIFTLMQILRQKNCYVSFLPINFKFSETSTAALEKGGIECLNQQNTSDTSALAWLEKNARRYDFIVVSRIDTMDALYAALRQFAPSAKIIFDTVDLHFLRESVEAELKQSKTLQRQAADNRQKELALFQACDETWVVSESERRFLETLNSKKNLRLISNIHTINPVQTGFFERCDIIFVGNFHHPPNFDGLNWFIQHSWPTLELEEPTIILHIVGRGLTDTQQLALQRKNILLHGHVENIQALLDKARINIAPLRYGAGAKGKISQALASGLPTIATAMAADGMFLQDQQSVLIANTPSAFAHAIKVLYSNEKLWQYIANNGVQIAKQHFSEEAAKQQLEELLSVPKHEN